MSYDQWKTTTPEDLEHLPECNCARCHKRHIEEGLVMKQRNKKDFDCCAEEYEDMVVKGKVCPFHPESYFEPAKDGKVAYCEECVEEERS